MAPGPIRFAWRCWLAARRRVFPILLSPIGHLRSYRQIRASYPSGPVVLGPRVALVCHFDRHGTLREDLPAYLAALGAAGLSVVLVSNAGYLAPSALERLRGLVACVLVRRNVGYDFGAWRDALEHLGLPRADTQFLLLANDSVYGPFAPLAPLLARMDFAVADLWGMTDSLQVRPHLQSYFLAVGSRALHSTAWSAFWRGVRPVPSKHWLIRWQEIGLTQRLLAAGFSYRALFPYGELIARATPRTKRFRAALAGTTPLNPSVELWRELLAAGFPFIKRELLRDNPTRAADLGDWREQVHAHFDADTGPIERDLAAGR